MQSTLILVHTPTFINIKPNNKSGFSLVELSIVLVIIGMLVGGVLVGQDMIRAAETRSIFTDKDRIQTAVNLFQQKYMGLPGDLTNATEFWGNMPYTCSSGDPPTPPFQNLGGTGTETCNGDGDGKIENAGGNAENMLIWQHLSNAGLIEGKYIGHWSGVFGQEGQNMKTKISNAIWIAIDGSNVPYNTPIEMFEGNHGNILSIHGVGSNEHDFLTTAEMWGIDKKIDDGLPGSGSVMTAEVNGANCNTIGLAAFSAIAHLVTYNLTYEQKTCMPVFAHVW